MECGVSSCPRKLSLQRWCIVSLTKSYSDNSYTTHLAGSELGSGIEITCVHSFDAHNNSFCNVSFLSPFHKQENCILESEINSLKSPIQQMENVGFYIMHAWSGLPIPSPRDLPDPGLEPASVMSPALAGTFFAISTT